MSAATLICRCWRWRDARIPPALRRLAFVLRLGVALARAAPGLLLGTGAGAAAGAGCVLAVFALRRLAALAPFTADLGHVFAVAADHLAAFLSGPARLLRIEFVRRAFLMGRLPALAGDFTLLRFAHGGKTAFGRRFLHAGLAGFSALALIATWMTGHVALLC